MGIFRSTTMTPNLAFAGSFYGMVDELTIKSSRSAGKLKFSEPKPPGSSHPVEYLRVSLEDREIAASSARIYIYEPYRFGRFLR